MLGYAIAKMGDGLSSRLLVGFLIVCLTLVALLMWQALTASRAQLMVAEGVLQDYASLIAAQFVRRVQGEVGFSGFQPVLQQLRDGVEVAPREGRPAPALLIRQAFEQRAPGEALLPIGDSRQADDLDFLAQHQNLLRPVQSGAVLVSRPLPEGGWVVVAAAATEAWPERLVGFTVNIPALHDWAVYVLSRQPLVPSVIANGKLHNHSVHLQFADHEGQLIFVNNVNYDRYLMIEHTVAPEEYAGVMAGAVIRASVDPALVDEIVVGGLPRSRLQLLLLLAVLGLVLMLIGILLIFRERALTRMRSDFIARVSHELRTPLTQIRMFAESLLLRRLAKPDDRQRALTVIDREARRLGHLVDNILRFSGNEKGSQHLHMEPLDPAILVQQIIEQAGLLMDERGVTVVTELQPGLRLSLDRNAFTQVMINLLENSVKYGPEDQQLAILMNRSKSGMVVFKVIDQGPGIPHAERNKVWRPYYRLGREWQSNTSGTGIGLALSRDLVRRMGGDCRFESRVGGGACVVLEFPPLDHQVAQA